MVNKIPDISVVVPSHNDERHIEDCLDSLLAQTLRPVEIIVCDDASSDRTMSVVRDWQHRHPEIPLLLVSHESHVGIPRNFNSGLLAASGEYVSLLAADDYWKPRKLELEYRALSEHKVRWAYSGVELQFDDDKGNATRREFQGTSGAYDGDIFLNVLHREVSPRCFLVERKALLEVGLFDESIGMYEDWDLKLRLAKACPVAQVAEPNVIYRQHDGGEHHAPMYRQMAEISKVLRKCAELMSDSDASLRRSILDEHWPEDAMPGERDRAARETALASLVLPYSPVSIKNDGDGLIFLVSLPRSGSTMLQRVLAGHPDIHTTAEPWLMLNPLYALKDAGVTADYDAGLGRQALREFLGELPGGEESYYDAVSQMGRTLYGRATRASGKSRFLDKTPRYVYILPELVRAFPKARFVVLLRNPLAILASVLNTWFHKDIHAFESSSHYKDMLEGPRLLAEAIDAAGDNLIVTRYEDIIGNPEAELRRLCEFLEVPFFSPMLNYGNQPAPSGSLGDPEKVNEQAAPVALYAEAWKRSFDTDELQAYAHTYVDRLGRGVFDKLGYPAAALCGELMPPCDASADVGLLNAEGEALFHSGDYSGALQKFNQALALDEQSALTINNLVVLYWQQGNVEQAIAECTRGLQLQPGHRELTLNAGAIFEAEGMVGTAEQLYRACLSHNPDDTDVASRLQALGGMPAPAGDTQVAENTVEVTKSGAEEDTYEPDATITIATSIAPFGLEKQQRAVDSWIALGLRVISLNIQKEIDTLAPHFPNVEFVRVERDGRKLAGKPYVYIDDMLKALHATDSHVVGIVNADIILRAGSDLCRHLNAMARDRLLYGSRIDIERADDTSGRLYNRGFDFYFFDRSLATVIPKSPFMLGIPWWDYWLPVAARLAGADVYRLDSPLGYHVWHKTNYSDRHLIQFAKVFASQCGDADFLHLYTQCVEGNYGAVRFSLLSDAALDYLSRNTARISLPQQAQVSADEAIVRSGNPRVSAIVSTYNSEAFIQGCLDNLLKQTIADEIEIIVIDAASTQNERAIVERYLRQYDNVRYYRTAERIGVYAAWNLAIKMARGKYLVTCSTNDRLRENACENLARSLDERSDLDLVYGNSVLSQVPHETFDRATIRGLYVWPEYTYEGLLDQCMVGPHPMWRKSVHDSLGYFDESLVALGDQEFWLRLGECGNLASIPDFTGVYYVSEDSITGDADLTQIETDKIHATYGWRYRYARWFRNRSARPENEDRQETGPLVSMLAILRGDQFEALADTLDSVAAQHYCNWKLTVVSSEACPDPQFHQEARLDWVQVPTGGSLGEALDRVLLQEEAAWISVIEAGDRLDPAFMSDAHAYLRKHDDWKLLYCDDDRADEAGDLSEPRFKPDFNLELLRASDYIGNACLLERQAVETAGGFCGGDHALVFDLVLRLHDRFGSGAIGHLADIRFHRGKRQTPTDAELSQQHRRQALQHHLQRCDEPADIQEAVLPGCFMLDYRTSLQPKVSILIDASRPAGYLPAVVQAVLEKTDYPDFEVHVLATDVVEAPVLAQLTQLSERDDRLVVTQAGKRHENSLGALVSRAGGEYLLWLNQDAMVLQPEWLYRLVEQAVRERVGIVGPRIVNRRKAVVSGGVIPGIGARSAGARCFEGLHMNSPGYMGRAQLAQEMGAVPGLCLMISKQLYERVGGHDPQLTISLYADIDLCGRVRETGYKVIWTPRVTLMYLAGRDYIDGVPRNEKQVSGEVQRLLEGRLKQLAHEPSYNRNLTTTRSDYALECNLIRGWDPEIDDGARILTFGTGSRGSWQYRVVQPMDAMHRQGNLKRTHFPFVGKNKLALPTVADLERLQPTALLMHNALHDDFIEAMQAYKRFNDTFIVFGQDDLMTALPPKNPFSKTVYKDIKQRLRKCLSLADRLVVTTEPLAQALQSMIGDVRVVPNYLDESVWAPLASRRGVAGKPRVGWAGAQQHLGDLEMIEQVVRETADVVDWVFFGMCPESLRPYAMEVHEAVRFEDYPSRLAALNLDIAIAPLEHNRFNEAKSNLRILEYGALGWPVIASDIEPYQGAPVCLVRNQPRAWINAIRERAGDIESAWKDGDRLREWVLDNWMLAQHSGDWLAALDPASPVSVSGLRKKQALA
jgi:GT2 family glycosyltransferase/tetratricopeptide (TPR) repeat protein